MGDLILTFNAGSSTIKLGFYEIAGDAAHCIARGVIDYRDDPFEICLVRDGRNISLPLTASADDLTAVLYQSFGWLTTQFDLDRLEVIGHRVVHGGDDFTGQTVITNKALAGIEALAALAPLHQPQSIRLIRAMRELYPDILQTASFDTAFHATHAPVVRRFAIPRALHDKGIKRYGFHGLSYRFIASALPDTGLPQEAKVVVAHLGSGASLCAMEDGISRDTSMGFSTIDGIPMATRSGALDPGVVLHLMGPMGWSLKQVETMLYHDSGLFGVSGFEADSRELMESNRPEAAEAIELFCHRIAGEVARLAATMGGIEALVFTAGIGEHQPAIRAMICKRLDWLGLDLDPATNASNATRISRPESRVQAFIIPTDEESVIAAEALGMSKTR